VWIDSNHQVRKMTLVESGKSIRVTSMMLVTSINQPVGITVPPASQVADAPEIP
jgi:thymidine phosphorylase